MADLYNHYKGVEPGSITSATASLKSKVEQLKSKVSSLKTSLSDDVWKAGAKATLLEAFDKIEGEVCEDILSKLANADEIAGLVEKYNTAKEKAEDYSSSLNSPDDDTSEETINTWRQGKKDQEQIMRDCVSEINGLL